jgi:hypothetical protein
MDPSGGLWHDGVTSVGFTSWRPPSHFGRDVEDNAIGVAEPLLVMERVFLDRQLKKECAAVGLDPLLLPLKIIDPETDVVDALGILSIPAHSSPLYLRRAIEIVPSPTRSFAAIRSMCP